MEGDEKMKNIKVKTSLRWGRMYEMNTKETTSYSDKNEFNINVVLLKLPENEIKMDSDSSVVNEVDSVKDDSNKNEPTETYLSDNGTSNFMKFKSTSDEFLDNWTLELSSTNTEIKDSNNQFPEGKLQIVENNSLLTNLDSDFFAENSELVMDDSNVTSRPIMNFFDDPKDSLDKMWNMKTLFRDIKTDYNYPFSEKDVKFEQDFKNNYLQPLPTKRSDPSNPADTLPECDDKLTIEFYKFEMEKLHRIVDVLKGQIAARDSEISRLNEKVQEYNHWKSELDPSKQASLVQYKAENDALIAVNFAKLQLQTEENERLSKRLMMMEEQHKEKDDEIKALREKIVEKELSSSKFDRDLKSLEIDKKMLKNSIEAIEKTFRQREIQLKLNLDMEYQNQLTNILKEQEQLVTLVSDKDTEIEKCKQLLKTAQLECSQLLNSIVKLKEVLMKKNQEIDLYKKNVIELESKLIANDKTSELKISRETQAKLREQIKQLERKLEMLEESFKVHSMVKEENLYLKAKLEKLEKNKTREKLSQNVMELGNQITPLSLANFRD